MDVFIAMEHDSYHSSTMLAVFSTQEKAETFLKCLCEDEVVKADEVFVSEMEVDSNYKRR